MLDEKNEEVEKLKDLCMKQREEIKALKSAILFPDVTNSQHELLLEKQGTELKPASKVIPTLQEQVASLTGQLQSLAEGLAEVKADKYAAKPYFDGHNGTPRTLVYDEEAANSLEFSYEDPITPGSPDDMILEDMNPCLTPRFAKTWTKDYGYNGPLCKEEEAFGNRVFKEKCVDNKKLFMSSKHSKKQSSGSSAPFMSSKHSKKQSSGSSAPATSKSDESTYRYGKFKY